MQALRKIIDLYIKSSIHVAAAVASFVGITDILLTINSRYQVYLFAFFGTIAGYNVIKYASLIRRRTLYTLQNRLIVVLSALSLTAAAYFYLQLNWKAQLAAAIGLILVVCYGIPILAKTRNLRNIGGLKIYLVSLCYIIITVLMPTFDADLHIGNEVAFLAVSRFIMIFVLVLVFDIIDMRSDSVQLKTIPQQIGLSKTKMLGSVLLVLFCLSQAFWVGNNQVLKTNMIIALIVAFFLWMASPEKPKYYTQLYLEALPIVWMLFLFL